MSEQDKTPGTGRKSGGQPDRPEGVGASSHGADAYGRNLAPLHNARMLSEPLQGPASSADAGSAPVSSAGGHRMTDRQKANHEKAEKELGFAFTYDLSDLHSDED